MSLSSEQILAVLRAVGEPSRLRIVLICDRVELTVGELSRVLRQSQPRVSRHLRLLVEAGVLERNAEGTSAFYRLTDAPFVADVLSAVKEYLDPDGHVDDALSRDRERLDAIRAERAQNAAVYFEEIAESWENVRPLHVADDVVERALLEASADMDIGTFLDVGTGTGRMLEVFADRIERGLGIDLSTRMLKLARSRLDRAGLRHCSVRHGNIYDLDVPAASIDLAVLHHVLHFLDDPGEAIGHIARSLRPGGRLLIVDFAPHANEILRTDHAHARLGFSDNQILRWCERAGLQHRHVTHLEPQTPPDGEPLTTSLWVADQGAMAAEIHPPLEHAS